MEFYRSNLHDNTLLKTIYSNKENYIDIMKHSKKIKFIYTNCFFIKD